MIEYKDGGTSPACTILIETPDELYEALEVLHTQVADNLGSFSPLLRVLESAMLSLVEKHGFDEDG